MLVFKKKKEIPLVESLFYILENLNYLQLCIMVATENAEWSVISKLYHIEDIKKRGGNDMKKMHVAPAGKLKNNFTVKAERVRNLTPTEFAHWMWGDPEILEKVEGGE